MVGRKKRKTSSKTSSRKKTTRKKVTRKKTTKKKAAKKTTKKKAAKKTTKKKITRKKSTAKKSIRRATKKKATRKKRSGLGVAPPPGKGGRRLTKYSGKNDFTEIDFSGAPIIVPTSVARELQRELENKNNKKEIKDTLTNYGKEKAKQIEDTATKGIFKAGWSSLMTWLMDNIF